jgi:hypothetical protein
MIPQNLEERNKWFNSLSRNVQRVEIAKDVIAQLNAGKYTAVNMQYFMVSGNIGDGSNLQEVVENANCSMCAMGAIFASKCRLGNDAVLKKGLYKSYYHEVDQVTKIVNPEEYVGDIFEEEQLRLMEVAFEGYDAAEYFFNEYGEYYENIGESLIECYDYDRAMEFYGERERTHTSTEIMIDIMNNIIDNNGEFVV